MVIDRGELVAFCLTPGNVDDRRPVPRLVRRLFGQFLTHLVGSRQCHQPKRPALNLNVPALLGAELIPN